MMSMVITIILIPPERARKRANRLIEAKMFKNSIRDFGKIKFCASVTTISSYSFEARGLKFGMKIHLITAVKLVGQIFEFLSRS